jgi:hypothetical protein
MRVMVKSGYDVASGLRPDVELGILPSGKALDQLQSHQLKSLETSFFSLRSLRAAGRGPSTAGGTLCRYRNSRKTSVYR